MIDIHEAYPYLRVHSAADAIDFYVRAFDAKELFRLTEPSGRIGHAELKLGPATVMLSDEFPEGGIRGPRSLGGTTCSIHLHVADVDTAFEQAVAAGAEVVRPLQDQFMASVPVPCGIRSGTNGCSGVIWRTYRRRRCSAATLPCSKNNIAGVQ